MKGVPIDVCDRTGRPIHIGDTLEFDKEEWGGENNVFTITLERGEIVMLGGGANDLEAFCTIIKGWDD